MFLLDRVFDGDQLISFRACRVADGTKVVKTPWGDERLVEEYGDGELELPLDGSKRLLALLLSGERRPEAMPIIKRIVVQDLEAPQLLGRVEEFAGALLRGTAARFQPFDGPDVQQVIRPQYVQVERDDNSAMLAFVGDELFSVGDRMVNALVWRTGYAQWHLEQI